MSNKKDVKKIKKGVFFNYFRVHKKVATFLIIGIGFIAFLFTINYGRYVKDIIEMYYLRSQNFYFSSDKLTVTGKSYEINPWGGTVDYGINISMSSLLNNIRATTVPINYEVSCEGDSKVDCYIDTLGTRTSTRIIDIGDHTDSFIVTVTPKANVNFVNGEKVKVKVQAQSTAPYVETLSATFELVIGDYGLNFEIEDNPGDNFFTALVTNTLDTTSKKITLKIDDSKIKSIFFDMTNPIMQQAGFSYKTSRVNSDDYITEVTFIVEPKSSLMVKYYKKDSTEDYSFVLGESNPAVIFNVEDVG